MKKIFVFIYLILFQSCSWFTDKDFKKKLVLKKISKEEYLYKLKKNGDFFLKTNKKRVKRLSKDSRKYLKRVYNRIIYKNKTIYRKYTKPKFYIIEDNIPYSFSTPQMTFFLSTKLFERYIRSEKILYVIFAIEIFRSYFNVYKKRDVIPTGYLGPKDMLFLTRLDLKEKNEVNKWAHESLESLNFDVLAVLNWIQIKHKNASDFFLQGLGASFFLEEEKSFKNFLTSNNKTFISKDIRQSNSSEGFYNFSKEIQK